MTHRPDIVFGDKRIISHLIGTFDILLPHGFYHGGTDVGQSGRNRAKELPPKVRRCKFMAIDIYRLREQRLLKRGKFCC